MSALQFMWSLPSHLIYNLIATHSIIFFFFFYHPKVYFPIFHNRRYTAHLSIFALPALSKHLFAGSWRDLHTHLCWAVSRSPWFLLCDRWRLCVWHTLQGEARHRPCLSCNLPAKCLAQEMQPYLSLLFNRTYQVKIWYTDIIWKKPWIYSQKGRKSQKYFGSFQLLLLHVTYVTSYRWLQCTSVCDVLTIVPVHCFLYFSLKYIKCSI